MDEETEQPEVRELQEERSRLTSLKEHTGWTYFLAIADAQLETRKQHLFLTPLPGLDATFAQEFEKGEISGIAFMRHFIDSRIETLTEEIEQRLSEEEEKRDERSSGKDSNDA